MGLSLCEPDTRALVAAMTWEHDVLAARRYGFSLDLTQIALISLSGYEAVLAAGREYDTGLR